jgi:predicted branched-subunit amino acid permease
MEEIVATGPAAPAVVPPPSGLVASEARAGVATAAPLLLAYAPFGLAIGAACAEHPDRAAGWAAGPLLFGGSAHLAVLGMLAAGSSLAVIVLTGLVVNARLLVYSAALARDWRGVPRRRRALAAFLLVDPTFVVATERAGRPGTEAQRRAFYLGAGATMWVGWVAAVTLGLLAGGHLGPGSGLQVAAPLCLAAAAVPHLRRAPGAAAVLVGAATALVGRSWPHGTGLLAAIVAGAAAGARLDRSDP